jgi:hypothetical protein
MKHVFLFNDGRIIVIEYQVEIVNPPDRKVIDRHSFIEYEINRHETNESYKEEERELEKLRKEKAKIESATYQGIFKLVDIKVITQTPINTSLVTNSFTITAEQFKMITDEIEKLSGEVNSNNKKLTFEEIAK